MGVSFCRPSIPSDCLFFSCRSQGGAGRGDAGADEWMDAALHGGREARGSVRASHRETPPASLDVCSCRGEQLQKRILSARFVSRGLREVTVVSNRTQATFIEWWWWGGGVTLGEGRLAVGSGVSAALVAHTCLFSTRQLVKACSQVFCWMCSKLGADNQEVR